MIEFDSCSGIVVGGTATGCHLLRIPRYSHTKSLPMEMYRFSQPFSVGGRTWRIRFYPNGRTDFPGLMVVSVTREDSFPEPARAGTRILLLDRERNQVPVSDDATFRMSEFSRAGARRSVYLDREYVEANCIVHDCLRIKVDLRVYMGYRSDDRGAACAAAPPDDLDRHLGDLLATQDGADVAIQVAGETFRAHRCILAARSPVFRTELFGPMRQSATADGAEVCIRIHDMVPQVFGALLHFVYTDSLPPEMTTGQGGDQEVVMAQHLLEAADRYDIPKLRLICEEKLCRCLDTSTVATTLVLAHQHHCHRLKEACIEFLRCPQVLSAVMTTDDFQLIKNYPNLLKELIGTPSGSQSREDAAPSTV